MRRYYDNMKIFVFIIRILGFLMCIKGYFIVFSKGYYPVFQSIEVKDWTIYLLPLSSIFLAEFVIATTKNLKKKINKKNSVEPES